MTWLIPRKDRYNKKLEQFHGVTEEGSEDQSENEEKEEHTEHQAP